MLPRLPRLRNLHPWPSLCVLCRTWTAGRLCKACTSRFAGPVPRCPRCALRLPTGAPLCGPCATSPPRFHHAVAAVDYAFPWDGLLLAFKFHGRVDLAPVLAERLRAVVPSTGADLVLPVPSSGERLRERGFNPAWELARRLAHPANPWLLQRVRHTPHQLAVPLAKRASQVRGAFALQKGGAAAVAGRRIAVVDDVLTTGATVQEIAHLLHRAGAASVAVWVLARTPTPGT